MTETAAAGLRDVTTKRRPTVVRIADQDNVAVALRGITAGELVPVGGETVVARQDVPAGHKIALAALDPEQPIIKYGMPIGLASAVIAPGDWVHSHNLRTALSGISEYRYAGSGKRQAAGGNRESGESSAASGESSVAVRRASSSGALSAPLTDLLAACRLPLPTFKGFRRRDGRVGTRNELWVLNTVGCVNHAAERIAKQAAERFAGRRPSVDGIHAFGHPYGCSQLGDDLKNTQRVLAGLLRHPNAGAVLILGLGCESNQLEELLALAGDIDRGRIAFFNTQDVIDELEEGSGAVAALVDRIANDRRVECPASDLVLGHKCGGSDGFSGISANPLVGRIADRVTSFGARVLLTEVPEMFGAEQALMNRAVDETVFGAIVRMIDDFKEYFLRHNQPLSENPSPGNKAGGLTTLEEKSLGAIQKGGHAPVSRVLRYGEPLRGGDGSGGLALLESPGNDGVSSTALTVSGATLLLFTTGRGTPLGFPVPTIKVSSNSEIAAKKPHWIDFNAGALLDGAATMEQLEDELFALILAVASGDRLANNETNGYREIAIWKEGVTL